MPNSRKTTKTYKGAWLEQDAIDKLNAKAQELGLDFTQLLNEIANGNIILNPGKGVEMPNQRKKNKRGITVYVHEEIRDALRAESARRGVTLARFLTEMFKVELRRLGYTINPSE